MRLSEAQCEFLKELVSWDGVATPSDLGPQWRRNQNAARQTCKRRGYVTFDGGYWRITPAGRRALEDQG